MNAAELYAEHRGDLSNARTAGYFNVPSVNRCIVAVYDAWQDVENAEGRVESTAAYERWWAARDALREAMA